MLDVGVRIELYETVAPAGEASTGYVGALVSDDHFRLETVPAVGELVSMSSIATSRHDRHDEGVPSPMPLEDPRHMPFLAVRQVEHYLRPADPARTSPAAPSTGSVLVLHAEMPHPSFLPDIVAAYHHDGWGVMLGNDHDSPLHQAWQQALATTR